jgi:hypothetical protein
MRENGDCVKEYKIVRENEYCLEDRSSRQGGNDISLDNEKKMFLRKDEEGRSMYNEFGIVSKWKCCSCIQEEI